MEKSPNVPFRVSAQSYWLASRILPVGAERNRSSLPNRANPLRTQRSIALQPGYSRRGLVHCFPSASRAADAEARRPHWPVHSGRSSQHRSRTNGFYRVTPERQAAVVDGLGYASLPLSGFVQRRRCGIAGDICAWYSVIVRVISVCKRLQTTTNVSKRLIYD